MNSDPYDSAAWRSFGMLDAEESALFEDAMRHDPELRRTSIELDRLAAAIAAITAEPAHPAPEQLERLQRALGHLKAARKCPLWIATTGWGTALGLAALVAWLVTTRVEEEPAAARAEPEQATPAARETEDSLMETRRLSQEIAVLRNNLEEFHQRDRVLFQVLPGRALQIVMTMVPPGADARSSGRLASTAMLGDALAAINRATGAIPEPPGDELGDEEAELPPAPPPGPPMAVPIYDAARDTGTLVVNNLPPAPQGKVYHLWVDPSPGGKPVCLGRLPDSSVSGAESFDFNLGSTMILPAAFMLTLDPPESPSLPGEHNTVLAGPPAAR
jgi:anti-sigma-K factor RskA